MGLFSKIGDFFMKLSGVNTQLSDVPTYEKLTPEIIDATDDTDLDTLIFNQVMCLAEKNHVLFNEQVIDMGEIYINCTILNQAYMMADSDFELDLAENFELLPYFPKTFEAVNLPSLQRLFEELIQFIEQNYQNKLPFDFNDEGCLESKAYLEFENNIKPFAEAFRKLIKSKNLDLIDVEIDYIRSNKHRLKH